MGVISGPHGAAKKIKELYERVNVLSEARLKLFEMYKIMKKECARMQRSIITHMMVSRRLQNDNARLEKRVDILSASRYYLSDKIDDQAKTIAKQEEVVNAMLDKIERPMGMSQDSNTVQVAQEDGTEIADGDNQPGKVDEDKMDPVAYRLSKDSRIKAIGYAIGSIKSNLIWGKFNGSTSELDDLFKEVEELLD